VKSLPGLRWRVATLLALASAISYIDRQALSVNASLDWRPSEKIRVSPLFSHLQLVTCRTFETPAASTIPLFGLDEEYVRKIYGADAVALLLPETHPEEKISDMIRSPEKYVDVVLSIRRNLTAQHSYMARMQQLVELTRS